MGDLLLLLMLGFGQLLGLEGFALGLLGFFVLVDEEWVLLIGVNDVVVKHFDDLFTVIHRRSQQERTHLPLQNHVFLAH